VITQHEIPVIGFYMTNKEESFQSYLIKLEMMVQESRFLIAKRIARSSNIKHGVG